jgi:hypothetical protein
MMVMGIQATKIVARAIVSAAVARLTSDCIMYAVENIKCLEKAKPVIEKIVK